MFRQYCALVLTIVSVISGGGIRIASAQAADAAATSQSLATMEFDDVRAFQELIDASGQTEQTRQLIREGLASDNRTAQMRALSLSKGGSDEFKSEVASLYAKSNHDPGLRSLCLDAIQIGDSADKGSRFMELLHSEKNASARARLYSCIANSDASQLDFLIESLESPDASVEERVSILGNLSHYPTTRTVELLLDQWQEASDANLRAAALGALGYLSAYRVPPPRDSRPGVFYIPRVMFIFHDVPGVDEIDEPVCEKLEDIFLSAYESGSELIKKWILDVSAIIATKKSVALLQSVAADETAGDLQAYAKEQLEIVFP